MLLILPSTVLQQIVNYLDTNAYLAIELTNTAFTYVSMHPYRCIPRLMFRITHHLPYFKSLLYPFSSCPSSFSIPPLFSFPPPFSLSPPLPLTFCYRLIALNNWKQLCAERLKEDIAFFGGKSMLDLKQMYNHHRMYTDERNERDECDERL